jgi:peptide/nickel transport system ATP-binding protein
MSDQLLVMQKGHLVEIGDADEIYAMPKSPYTKSLIGAIPKGINVNNNTSGKSSPNT